MPSVGPDTVITFARDLTRHGVIRRTEGNGVEAEIGALSDGRIAAMLALAASSATNSTSALRHTIKYLRDGDLTSAGDGQQNSGRVQVGMRFVIDDAAGLFGGTVRPRLLGLYQSGTTAIINVRFESATSVRVFLSGVTPSVASCPDISTPGEHTITLFYQRAGVSGRTAALRLWIDGTEITLSGAVTNHAQTHTISTWEPMLRNDQDALTAGQEPVLGVLQSWTRFGDRATPAAFPWADWSEGGKPRGRARWCDVTDDEAILAVDCLPGEVGYTSLYSRVLWAVGETWPGDGAAIVTDAIEHTLAGFHLAHHLIEHGGAAPAERLMAKVVLQDAATEPAETWTSGVYTVRPHGSPAGATLTRPLDVWPVWCMKGYGRGQGGGWRVIAANIDPDADTVIAMIEDEMYSDDRELPETDALAFPYDQVLPHEPTEAIPAGSGVGVMTSLRMLTESEGYDLVMAQVTGWRVSGVSDHCFHNNHTLAWAGDMTEVGDPFGTMTRDECNTRGNDFIRRAIVPGILGRPAQGADPHEPAYSTKRIGPILFIALDTTRYAVPNGTKLGAVQLAWARAQIQETDAKTVVICSPQAMFDAVYKNLDWNFYASWRVERDQLLADATANPAIEHGVVLVGDSHIPWWYPSPSPSNPKWLGEFSTGAFSSTNLAPIASADEVADILAVVTAGGRDGWVGPMSGAVGTYAGGELGDVRHQRRMGRCRFDIDGSLTLTVYHADEDPEAAFSTDLAARLLQTVILQAWTNDTPISSPRSRSRARSAWTNGVLS